MEAFNSSFEPRSKGTWWSLCIEKELVSLHEPVARGIQTSAQAHLINSRRYSKLFEPVKTNLTCLTCLRHKPEHVKACGHSLCDNCVRIFGNGVIGFEHQFVVPSCIPCQDQSSLVVQLKPPTAGVRILCIDGGGVRGIIPLKTMALLQSLVGPDILIQDLFDLKFGTSAGWTPSLNTMFPLLTLYRRTHRPWSFAAMVGTSVHGRFPCLGKAGLQRCRPGQVNICYHQAIVEMLAFRLRP
jgi:hypothetical protein